MITDCLQKEAAKRPTAAELLKHPFFKKAKDKKYLQQTLVAIGPSLETRVQKVQVFQSFFGIFLNFLVGFQTATGRFWATTPEGDGRMGLVQ